MVPARLLFSLASSVLSEHLPQAYHAFSRAADFLNVGSPDGAFSEQGASAHVFAKRDTSSRFREDPKLYAFAVLIPVLVILSGIFAGLTLGYMSLDETQLNVLSLSGTPKQREYANKIKPIRKNGHLLLVTLLLANMITNETLPVISDPVLGGGIPAVVVSTALIVIFAEIIPQSICTRHGLYIGAKMAGTVRFLIYLFGIVAWPVAKLLEFMLGPHHGIIYRRAELKELIAMHGSENPNGGDLRTDTVTIIGATLDLQDKTVRQAMTPMDRVFMLHIDAKLDYDTLRRICATGHSRIPVYEEVEITVPARVAIMAHELGTGDGSQIPAPNKKSLDGDSLFKTKVKKIIGVLLVKQCVLLDPEDAVPVRKMRIIKVPFVPQNEPLLGILDRFQEGRSHMAIVSRLSAEKAQSVKKAVRKGLTQRLLGALQGDSSSSDDSEDEDEKKGNDKSSNDESSTVGKDEDSNAAKSQVKFSNDNEKRHSRKRGRKKKRDQDLEKGDLDVETQRVKDKERVYKGALEQRMPADAVLSKENAEEYLASQGFDPSIMPLGIITLEDVLEELIGEEIYDEFDVEGTGAHSESFVPPGAHPQQTGKALKRKISAPELTVSGTNDGNGHLQDPVPPLPTNGGSRALFMPKPIALTSLKSLGFLRSRSAPPTPREAAKPLPGSSSGGTPTGTATPVAPTISGQKSGEDAQTSSLEIQPVSGPLLIQTNSEALEQIEERPSPEDEKAQSMEIAAAAQPGDAADKAPSPPTYPFPHVTPTGTPRSASPAPLEAILLDRKRRVVSSPRPIEAASSSAPTPEPRLKTKGGFKSSPLTPLKPDADAVVADQIKKEKREREARG